MTIKASVRKAVAGDTCDLIEVITLVTLAVGYGSGPPDTQYTKNRPGSKQIKAPSGDRSVIRKGRCKPSDHSDRCP